MLDGRYTIHLNYYFYYNVNKHSRMEVPLFIPNRQSSMKNTFFASSNYIIRKVMHTTHVSIFLSTQPLSVLERFYFWPTTNDETEKHDYGLLLVTGKLRVRGWTKSGLCGSKLVLLTELKEEPHSPTAGSDSGGRWRTGHRQRCEKETQYRAACSKAQLTDHKYCKFKEQGFLVSLKCSCVESWEMRLKGNSGHRVRKYPGCYARISLSPKLSESKGTDHTRC